MKDTRQKFRPSKKIRNFSYRNAKNFAKNINRIKIDLESYDPLLLTERKRAKSVPKA